MSGPAPDLSAQLTGLDFPVSKEDVLRRAQETGADTETLAALRSLPVTQFDSPAELAQVLAQPTGS